MYPSLVHGCAPSGRQYKPAVVNGCEQHMCSCLRIGLRSVQACVVKGRHTSGACVPVDVCCCVCL